MSRRDSRVRTAQRRFGLTATVVVAGLVLGACGDTDGDENAIAISGSATVEPVTQAVADKGRFVVDIAAEGTTDGFERFCSGETSINNASVPIPGAEMPTDYLAMCEENGVEFVEIPIGLDSLSLIRNEANRFARDLTMDEIRRAWEPDSDVTTWQDLRPEWPDEEIGFYGRPEGSGTFAYLTHEVSGEVGGIRDDYEATDDTDELASWIAEDPDGFGFMGVGNYLAAPGEDRDRITNVSVDGVAPTLENARSGEYRPFTRPLLVYVNIDDAAGDERLSEFVDYYVAEIQRILPLVYYYPMSDEEHELAAERWRDRVTGSMFGGDSFADVSLAEVLRGE